MSIGILKSRGYAYETGEEPVPGGDSSGIDVTLELQQYMLAMQL